MTNYGTLIDNQLHPAPRAFMLHGAMVTNPKAEHFAALNEERAKQGLPLYYPIPDDATPTSPEGKVVRFNGYAVVHGWITPQYSFEDAPPPPPRTFDRYKVVTALKGKGVWRDVRNALLAEDEDALDMLFTAEDITEDEPLLSAMIAMLKAAPFGWTDEQVEAVLAASVKEGY